MLEPHSVDQLLRVLELARQNTRLGFATPVACSRAIHQVSRDEGVTYQTIGDGCRRRLGLKDMSEFHRLVEEWLAGDPAKLTAVLRRNASAGSAQTINTFFSTTAKPEPTRDTASGSHDLTPLPVSLGGGDVRLLNALSQLVGRDVQTLATELLHAAIRDRFRAALAVELTRNEVTTSPST